ncbi:rhodanese-like domain-containing protein [Streptomyces sp. NPDC021562]|uniref:rhodanese-like domain-containing protein n=1 Tax=Streptomyces sp. NPDC021562 TaxID=3155121 RepID=UPI0033CB54E0
MTTPPPGIDPDHARTRLQEWTVVDVRTPGEYAAGHLPGAHNVPLGSLRRALPALRAVDGGLLLVCASGNRAEQARADLAEHGVQASVLAGGTRGWTERGHGLHRPERGRSRSPWAMERQVRLAAGAAVLAGLGLGLVHPAWRLLPAGVAGGLVFSALTDTCGMAALLARLPHNRPHATDLDAILARLGSARG